MLRRVRFFFVVLAGAWFCSFAKPAQDPQELIRMAEELEKTVVKLRGLPFKEKVKKGVKSKDELREYFLKELREEMPSEKLWDFSKAYKLLGLIPENYDLENGIIEVIVSQVAGFYDPKTKEFYLIAGLPRSMQKIAMVHELTHALDDQYFPLQKMIDAVKDHEDRTFAVRAVVEGSGTLVMNRYQTTDLSLIKDMMGSERKEIFGLMNDQLRSLRGVPPYLVRSLAGPYLVGTLFLTRGEVAPMPGKNEEADIESAFRRPPLSSEQVLHPEKYWDPEKRDNPVEVCVGDWTSLLDEGWRKIAEDTLGEINVATIVIDPDELSLDGPMDLMTMPWTVEEAEGWDGDRFFALEKEEDQVVFWLSVWDSETDAEEFEGALRSKVKHSRMLRRGRQVLFVAANVDLKRFGEPEEWFSFFTVTEAPLFQNEQK